MKFLKKNPRMLEEDMLKRRLILSEGRTHPVLDALGGAKWFDEVDKAGMTVKEAQRQKRVCRNCGMTDVQKTLLLCGGCRIVYYW